MHELPPIHSDERIIRGLFTPLNFHKKTGKLLSNFYSLRAGEHGVSVLRPDISSVDSCRMHFKAIENPEKRRGYYGVALLYADEIQAVEHQDCILKIIPKEDKYADYILKQHAEIYYLINGSHFIPEAGAQGGVELPPIVSFIADRLAGITKIFHDQNPQSEIWLGDEITKDGRPIFVYNAPPLNAEEEKAKFPIQDNKASHRKLFLIVALLALAILIVSYIIYLLF